MKRFQITEAEYEAIKAKEAKTKDKNISRRLRVLMLRYEGKKLDEITKMTNLHRTSITQMCRRYREHGLEEYARNKYQSHRWLLRQYRTNELVRWRMHFLSDAIAEIEGLLEVNRGFCKKQMAEKAAPSLPTNCAVVPKCKTQSDERVRLRFLIALFPMLFLHSVALSCRDFASAEARRGLSVRPLHPFGAAAFGDNP